MFILISSWSLLLKTIDVINGCAKCSRLIWQVGWSLAQTNSHFVRVWWTSLVSIRMTWQSLVKSKLYIKMISLPEFLKMWNDVTERSRFCRSLATARLVHRAMGPIMGDHAVQLVSKQRSTISWLDISITVPIIRFSNILHLEHTYDALSSMPNFSVTYKRPWMLWSRTTQFGMVLVAKHATHC